VSIDFHNCIVKIKHDRITVLCRAHKGQMVLILIVPVNQLEGLWGKHAREFKYMYSGF